MVSHVCADDRCLDGVVSDREEADISRMVAAVTVLLQGLGEDLHRDGLVNTPFRVARAFASAMKGYRMSAKDVIGNSIFYERGTTDPNGFGGGGMVIVRDLDHFATCRSCLLPFKIRSHIAYIPSGGRIVGLSKLARVVEIYSNRLQTPQEFVDGVGQALSESFKSLGVAVVAESWHLQWPLGSNGTLNGNGVKAVSENKISWVPSQAYTGKGIFNDKSCGLWNELIALLQLEGTSIHLPALKESFDDAAIGSCPFLSQDWKSSLNGFDSAFLPTRCNGLSGIKSLPNGGLKKVAEGLANVEKGYDIRIEALPAMVAAVESMLYAVGQDPKSHELEHTSMRYVVWLLASTQGNKISPCCQSKTYNNSNGVSITPSIQSPVADFGDQLDMYIVSKLRLPFCSQCEHHLLPFSGFVHVGYFYNPKTPPIERSLVSRIVQLYSRRLQVQERLTREIAEAVLSHSSLGVMVVVEASHLCMVSRGVKTISSSTTTVATLGRFSKDVTSRADFLRTISKGKTDFVG